MMFIAYVLYTPLKAQVHRVFAERKTGPKKTKNAKTIPILKEIKDHIIIGLYGRK